MSDDDYEIPELPSLFYDAIFDENEMLSLPMLFKSHLNDLPKLSMVAEGIYGPTAFNDVSSGQFLWMHTYSTQERVIVREACDAKKLQYRHMSIPLDFNGKFRIVYSREKKGPERNLRQIIKGSQLPVQISFVRSEGIPLSTDTMLSQSVNLIAIKEHQYNYFLANCILQETDEPSLKPTVIMMEPDISICYIKGRKSMTQTGFKKYIDDMRKKLEKESTYDRTCGYPEIVEIFPEKMGINDGGISVPKSPDDPNPLTVDDVLPGKPTKPDLPPRKPITDPPMDRPKSPMDRPKPPMDPPKPSLIEKKKDDKHTQQPRHFVKKKTLPIVPNPKPKQVDSKSLPVYDELSPSDPVREKKGNGYTPMPGNSMKSKTSPTQKSIDQAVCEPESCYEKIPGDESDENVYEPIGEVEEMKKGIKFTDAETLKNTTFKDEHKNTKQTNVRSLPKIDSSNPASNNVSPLSTECNVSHFKIEDVCRCLSQLGLDQFIESFRKERIDGTILSELNRDILKTDFGFSSTQAIRLMKFIREGHIPK